MISLASRAWLDETSRRAATIVARAKKQQKEAERVEASTMPDRSDEPHRRPPFWIRHKRQWPILLLAPVLLVVLGFGVDRARHGDQVLRGIELAGETLAGLDREASRAVVTGYESTLRTKSLPVTVQGKRFELAPEKVDLRLEVDATLDEAMRLGRDGNMVSQLGWWLQSFTHRTSLQPACQLDAGALNGFFDKWEEEAITDPPFEGAVLIVDGQAVEEAPREGHRIDRQAAVGLLSAALCRQEHEPVDLPLTKVPPVRVAATTNAAFALANKLLSGPITLVGQLPPPELDDEEQEAKSRARAPKPDVTAKPSDEAPVEPAMESFTFQPAVLAKAIRSKEVGADGLDIYLDAEALEPALVAAREKLERKPVEARFVVERGDKVRILPSRIGRVIDANKVAQALLAAAATPERQAPFPIEEGALPKLSTADAEALKITKLVSSFTTTHPCCRPRVENIHKIADLIDGVLLKPGDRFSINEHVGERTMRNGFKPAPTIVEGEMEDTIGGGISQFATTFFNAALNGAYEIIERQPHSFYFSRYPMGLEATLSYPKPDVIIRNDTDNGLLIKTYYTGVSITVKMFGDNGGRKIKRKVSRPFDLTEPPVEYEADDTLEPDETKVKVRGKHGWTVTTARIVIFPDGTEKEESRKVVYKPRIREIRVHSCRIPKGKDGYTGKACPEPPEDDDDDDDDDDDVPERVDTQGGDAGQPPDEDLDETG